MGLSERKEGVTLFEFGLGIILAVVFVTVYLLISSFFRRDQNELAGLGQDVSLNPADAERALTAGRSKQVLTSGESNERTSGDAKDDVEKENRS
jgi:hypothetical protein